MKPLYLSYQLSLNLISVTRKCWSLAKKAANDNIFTWIKILDLSSTVEEIDSMTNYQVISFMDFTSGVKLDKPSQIIGFRVWFERRRHLSTGYLVASYHPFWSLNEELNLGIYPRSDSGSTISITPTQRSHIYCDWILGSFSYGWIASPCAFITQPCKLVVCWG